MTTRRSERSKVRCGALNWPFAAAVSSNFAAMRRFLLSLAAVLACFAAAVPAAQARDAVVKSFDGTPIVTHFFPAPGLKNGQRAPTIMIGHGWGGTGATEPPENYAKAG